MDKIFDLFVESAGRLRAVGVFSCVRVSHVT